MKKLVKLIGNLAIVEKVDNREIADLLIAYLGKNLLRATGRDGFILVKRRDDDTQRKEASAKNEAEECWSNKKATKTGRQYRKAWSQDAHDYAVLQSGGI